MASKKFKVSNFITRLRSKVARQRSSRVPQKRRKHQVKNQLRQPIRKLRQSLQRLGRLKDRNLVTKPQAQQVTFKWHQPANRYSNRLTQRQRTRSPSRRSPPLSTKTRQLLHSPYASQACLKVNRIKHFSDR